MDISLDVLLAVATAYDVVNGAFVFNTQFPSHAKRVKLTVNRVNSWDCPLNRYCWLIFWIRLVVDRPATKEMN